MEHKKFKAYHMIIILFLVAFSAVMMYPIVWMFCTSFKSNAEIHMNKTQFFPTEWTIEGYETALEKAPIGTWFFNSVMITAVVTMIVIITSTLLGYVFAKYEFKLKKPLFMLSLATMMVPSQVTIIPSMVSAFSIYLAKQFIEDIPNSICEAAKIDGAGPMKIYWHVILPMIRPAIGSIGIFTAMAHWNDYLNPLIMLNDKEKMTLPLGLVYFSSQRGEDLAAIMAVGTMIMVPMIISFLIFQKQFIKGLALSGIK